MRLNRIVLAFLFALAVSPSFGDYLYWMIDDGSYRAWENPSFAFAKIRVDGKQQYDLMLSYVDSDNPTYESTYLLASDGGISEDLTVTPGTRIDGAWANLDLVDVDATTSFVIELYNENMTRVGRSVVSYGALENSIFDAKLTGRELGPSKAFGAWGVVPEPSSGLLMLCGLALLALKRKRAH